MTATAALLKQLIAALAKVVEPASEGELPPEAETATAETPPLKLADPHATEPEVVPTTCHGQRGNRRAVASEPRKSSPTVEDSAEQEADPMPVKTLLPAPLAVDAKQLATMLGLSLRTVRAMDAAGKLPRPVRLGHAVRWPLRIIEDWLQAGAPDRKTWQAIEKGGRH